MPQLRNPFAEWNRDFALLAVAVFGVGTFFGVQLTLFNNFIVERFGIEPHELGYLEGLREVPGLLNVLLIALLIRRPLPIVAGVALIVMGAGLAAYSMVSTIFALTVFSFIWSIGFHVWAPLEQSMALQFSPPGPKGKWLGQLRSVGGIAWLSAIGVCILGLRVFNYQGMFIMAGVTTVLGGVVLMFVRRRSPFIDEKGFVFKRRYSVYYLLNFLQGCRKQMFITFAIFALVKVHGMPVEITMVLVLVNQVLVTLTAPLMGRLVDRYGERIMLSISYVLLALVFFGYAVVQHLPSLYALYVVDNMVFFGGIALTTYLNKITPREEIKQTLSMGVTMNHVASVAAPLVGGLAWHFFGYQIIFFSGSILAIISLVVSQWVDPEGMLKREDEAATVLEETSAPKPVS